MLEAVFFDLDGTLVDTAPDFYVVLNQVLEAHGHPPVSYQAVRATVSNGARALTELGFGLAPGDEGFDQRLNDLLEAYGRRLDVDTRLFEGMPESLAWLESNCLPWGVVTNKPERFTRPVLAGLGLLERAVAVICPDQVAERKPHPEGLLMAAAAASANPVHCLYVGDHLRDIQAGLNAKMVTATAAFGYVDADDNPRAWPADHYLERGEDLPALLRSLNQDS